LAAVAATAGCTGHVRAEVQTQAEAVGHHAAGAWQHAGPVAGSGVAAAAGDGAACAAVGTAASTADALEGY